VGKTVQSAPVVDPTLPGFNPIVISPIALGISPALQPFDIVGVFLTAAAAKPVGNPKLKVLFIPGCIDVDLGAAFFAFPLAPGTVKHFLDGKDFASLPDDGLGFRRKRPPVVHIDYFRHHRPSVVKKEAELRNFTLVIALPFNRVNCRGNRVIACKHIKVPKVS
jgi:hypothetical protein